jgi:O-antigen/teichoic acid export membrane protein
MGTFAFAAMRVAIGPQIARLLAQRRESDAEAVFQTATWWLMALSWPFYLVLALFPGTVLGLFGHAFGVGAVALALLCLTELFDMGTGNITLVLLMGGRSKWNLINIFLGLVTTVGLDWLLIPHYGVVGAAIGSGASTIVVNLAAVIQVAAFMKMKPFGTGYWYVVGLSAGTFVGVGLITLGLGLRGPLALATTIVIGGALYVVLLFRFRFRLRLDLLAQALAPRSAAAREQVA